MTSREIDVDDLVGGEFDFYGVAGQRFNLDGLVYEAIEDNRGVFGTSLDYVMLCDDNAFPVCSLPLARVVVEEDCGLYELIDLHDGHCWLKFGTEYHYNEASGESFVFDYSLKHDETA